jgi:hypothetical protein
VVSNSGKYLSAVQISTSDPDARDFLSVGHTCALLQLAPLYVDNTRDGKGDYFWVYNLLRFDGGATGDANELLPGFRKWILYTYKANHRATTLLSDEQKAATWTVRDWARAIDPY